MIRLALAKGRISTAVIDILAKKGINFNYSEDSRKLVMTDEANSREAILVKPLDTPIYVETGVADCGIVGRDVILEEDPDVYRLFSLDAAKCKICVAGKPGFNIKKAKNIKIASKYIRITEQYFENLEIPHQVIKLNGSVELAPILGMADVIVDIVETGSTLKANGLVVLETIYDISPVFIVNKVALKTKHKELSELVRAVFPDGEI